MYTNGDFTQRLPNNLNLSFKNINGQKFMERITNIAFSSGSACNSNSQEPSHVLKAISIPDELIKSTIRLSFGRFNCFDEVKKSSEIIIKSYKSTYKSKSY